MFKVNGILLPFPNTSKKYVCKHPVCSYTEGRWEEALRSNRYNILERDSLRKYGRDEVSSVLFTSGPQAGFLAIHHTEVLSTGAVPNFQIYFDQLDPFATSFVLRALKLDTPNFNQIVGLLEQKTQVENSPFDFDKDQFVSNARQYSDKVQELGFKF